MRDKYSYGLRIGAALLLSALALAGSAFLSIVWADNFIYGVAMLLIVWYLVVRQTRVFKFAVIPLAALAAVPPYPNWIYFDNDGGLRFVFSIEKFTTSPGGLAVLFIYFLLIYVGIFFSARRSLDAASVRRKT